MDYLEVHPINFRVVCLNRPYMKSLCIFEGLSRRLGCYYNHHKPQVVWCNADIKLPAPRIVRVRGHALHHCPTGDTPNINTIIKIGTYFVFHLADWNQIETIKLLLNGIESVPYKQEVPPKICLEFIPSTEMEGQPELRVHTSPCTETRHQNGSDSTNCFEVRNFTNSCTCPTGDNVNSLERNQHTNNSTETGMNDYNTHLSLEGESQESKEVSAQSYRSLEVDLSTSEVVITLADDDEDECLSDDSDDLHKVTQKKLTVDITPLINYAQIDNGVLVILLHPSQPDQAWQFLSACLMVYSRNNSKKTAQESIKVPKKTLSRTKPLYFSKTGTVSKLP